MSQHSVELPRFKLKFLHPRYWGTWLLVGLLYAISWTPFRFQVALGRGIGKLLYKLLPSRTHIARRNLELAFPEQDAAAREKLVQENFINMGIALFETGMAWWWPDWRIRRKISVTGWEHVAAAQRDHKGIFLLLFHFVDLEVHARAVGLYHPSVGLYRPHNNPVMEYLQTRGRNRSNKYMIKRRNVRGMLDALAAGELCGYLPDQDYGRRRAVFVPFFAMPETATTTGTSIFANQDHTVTLISMLERLPGARGYRLHFWPPAQEIPSGDQTEDARRVNQEVEEAVRYQPDMYLWVHRRFKTRPDEQGPNLYKKS